MKECIQNIDELNLHDTCLLEIRAQMDQVRLYLEYILDYDTQDREKRILCFYNVSWMSVTRWPRHTPPEFLDQGEEVREGVRRYITINTHTPATIEIVCEELEMVDEAEEPPWPTRDG